MYKIATTFFFSLVCLLGARALGEIAKVQILTQVKKGTTTQIVPVSFELAPKNRPHSSSAVLLEAPFPGLEAIRSTQGVSSKAFRDPSGGLFEEIEIELADKRKKRVYQKLRYGGSEVVTGEYQNLHPASRTEFARFFVESFQPIKSVESFSKTIFSMQNLAEKKNSFNAQCKFLKQQQLEVLEKVKIEKVVFDLLLEGACL